MAHAREKLALERIGSLGFLTLQFQLLIREPDLLRGFPLRGYVANDGCDAESVVRPEWAQTDFHRELGSIFAPRLQNVALAHRSRRRVRPIPAPMLGMPRPHVARKQQIDVA